MSRDAGFRHADVDTAILDDPKVRALVRSTKDEGTVSRAIVAYLSVLTSSWARGERDTLEDSAPLWLSGLDDLAKRLATVGLLDGDGRIPEHAWNSWFKPAWERQETTRDRWRRANRKRYRAATAESPRVDNGHTTLPSLPSGPTSQAQHTRTRSAPGRKPGAPVATNGSLPSTPGFVGPERIESRDLEPFLQVVTKP